MTITATHINLYHVCLRELWLHTNGIRMEHNSQAVAEGKFIGETTYPQRAEKYTEIEVAGSKIDFYDAKNKVVHEIKKSPGMEPAHEWQVKFYIWLLEQSGITGVTGRLEYPKMRETKDVILSLDDVSYLEKVVNKIQLLVCNEICPPCINKKVCKTCSYHDFCYIDEG